MSEKNLLEKDLARLATRRALEKLGREGKMGAALRKEAKEQINRSQIPKLVNELVEKEFAIDEKRGMVAADLALELQKCFGLAGMSVILMGSSAHGGVRTRDVIGVSNSESDFDWGITLDELSINTEKFLDLRKDIGTYGNGLLGKLSEKHGIEPRLEGCLMYNPLSKWVWNYKDADEAGLDLVNLVNKEQVKYLIAERWFLYFNPSFPKEKNEYNRKFILEALTKVASYDRAKWEMLTSKIIECWQTIHSLKTKYLQGEENGRRRDKKLMYKVIELSGIEMPRRMRELILVTGKTEE